MEVGSLREALLGLRSQVKYLSSMAKDATIEEIGDGNMNFVYRVSWRESDSETHSLIVKYTPAYIKCLGPQYALTASRLKVEHNALSHFHSAAPGLCPQPYYYDEQTSILIMEDMRTFRGMRSEIIKGEISIPAIISVAKFAAKVHRQYHVAHLPSERWEQLCMDFSNSDLVEITRQFLFQRPFDGDDPTNKSPEITRDLAAEMRASEDVKVRVSSLREKFIGRKECLLHGDLHSGSVMVDGDKACVIDAEFACIGPAAFEIGMYMVQFCVTWLAHWHACPLSDDSTGRKEHLLDTIESSIGHVWETYKAEYFMPSANDDVIVETWHDALGFGACEATRRVIGAAPIPDLATDKSLLAVLQFSYHLLSRGSEIRSVDQLVACVKSFA